MKPAAANWTLIAVTAAANWTLIAVTAALIALLLWTARQRDTEREQWRLQVNHFADLVWRLERAVEGVE